MKLILPTNIYREIIEHALSGKPNEVCGILAGKSFFITKIYKMTNTENSPESYLMDPKEQFAVMRDLRKNDLEMLAIYHSHPHSPARPSQKDIDMAFYPNVAYLIVSLKDNEPYIKGYKIVNKAVTEIEIILTEEKNSE